MNSDRQILATLLVLLSIFGCASDPTFDEYARSMPPVPADDGRIYIYRITKVGDAIRPSVRIDGEPVARAIPNGFFYLDLPAGEYEISAARNTENVLPVRLETGDEKYVRLDVTIGIASWQFTPMLVSADVANKEMKNTAYTGEKGAATQ